MCTNLNIYWYILKQEIDTKENDGDSLILFLSFCAYK